MGKRPIIPASDLQNFVTPPKRRTIRKRKVSNGNIGASTVGRPVKAVRLNSDADDDEDSSSNDTHVLNCSTKHANNSSILLNSSLKLEQTSPATNDSPRPVYTLRPSIVNGTILYDLTEKPWRLGNPIGKGNFGEIFLASDNITIPVTNENAKFVVKVEPHSNGPLFVEIHCLMNTAKKEENPDENEVTVEEKIRQGQNKCAAEPIKSSPPLGIPDYIASGSHFFGDARYRFLVLQRFDKDLHSLIKNSCVAQKSVLTLAIQIVNVLENLHDKGYCHNDVKSQNLMISKCKYYKNKSSTMSKVGVTATITEKTTKTSKTTKTIKNASKYIEKYEEKQPTTDSGNSSEQEANDYEYYDNDDDDEDFVLKRKPNKRLVDEETTDGDYEDFDDGTSNSNSIDIYKTPKMKNGRKHRRLNNRTIVQYSGSNPVRSCRRPQRQNSIYEEMVNSHYLRPSSKRISYSELFDEDGNSIKGDNDNLQNGEGDSRDTNFNSTEDDDSNAFLPISLRRRFEQRTTPASKQKSRNARSTATAAHNNNSNKIVKCSPKRLTRRQEKLLNEQQQHKQNSFETNAVQLQQPPQENVLVEAEHIFLIDFGLASKYIDRGVHRPFIMDQRRAHDGTLEFTSRDAHMGAHSRRSDLECLGFNLLYWSQGFLPWKDAAAQQHQEKVHRAKEYLMTDVREMLKLIYGKNVPKYLGEFLHLVGQLAYHERPQYSRYRRLFENEYRQLGYSLTNMCLDSNDIARGCVRIRKDHGVGKHDFFEQNNKLSNSHILSIMKSGGTPFQERGSIGDRVSPKNLRSKSDKKSTRKKKFCWAEVLSQDPDQIARERAEKEFDRELNDEEERPVRRYEGNPTYAILDLIKKNEEKFKQENDDVEDEELNEEEDDGQNDFEEEEENEVTEASDVEAEASDDDNENVENNEDEDIGGEDDEAVSGSDSDESMQETDGSDDGNLEDSEDNMSVEENDNDNDSDDDMESDVSEASSNSEQCGTRGRNKQRINRNNVAAYQKATKGKTTTKPTRRAVSAANSRSSKSTTTSSNASRIGRRGSTKITTRSNGPVTTTVARAMKTMTQQQQQKSKPAGSRNNTKRTTKTKRNVGGAFAASAAGEVEQQALKQFLYDHCNQQMQHQQQQHLNGNMSKKCGKRRRCPQKTENSLELMNGDGGGRGGMYGVEDESNSNLMMLNIWKMSNENIYARNAAAAAKSIAVGGGMVTRHYRK